jgi:hypothetical protein
MLLLFSASTFRGEGTSALKGQATCAKFFTVEIPRFHTAYENLQLACPARLNSSISDGSYI